MSRVFGRVFLATIFFALTGSLVHAISGNKTMKLKDVVVGKVVQVGNIKFAKVAADKYLALNLCPVGSTYSSFYKGCVVKTTTFDYTGDYQTFTAPATGTYVVELWGASGGGPTGGGYVSGQTIINSNQSLYLYLGQHGERSNYGILNGNTIDFLFNGGGRLIPTGQSAYGQGGGATDLRTINGDWNNINSLASRMIVAAGGGGDGGHCKSYVYAGGLTGWDTFVSCNYNVIRSYGGTQIDGGSGYDKGGFGYGGSGRGQWNGGGSGGSGWYGGGGGQVSQGSGGSSYISGHTGCVAVTSITDTTPKAGCTTGTSDRNCSLSPTGYSFTNTVMIDGAGYSWTNTKGELTPMPDPTSVGSYYASGVGHTGHGAARITQLSVYLGI